MEKRKVNPKVGSYMERTCANGSCPHPFERFLSLSGIETFCPACRNRAECQQIAEKRSQRIMRWHQMGAGMRLLFTEGDFPSAAFPRSAPSA